MKDVSSQFGVGIGIGVSGCLFLIFLTLKLAEVGRVAAWSWLWVTSPLWIPALIVGMTIIVGLILAAIFS